MCVCSELVRDRWVHRRPYLLTLKKCHCVVTAAHCLHNSKLVQGLHMAAQHNRRTNAFNTHAHKHLQDLEEFKSSRCD